MEIIPHRLKDARHRKKLTQQELASRTGMDQAHISRMEKGGRGASKEHLQALARELDTTISHLIGEDIASPWGSYTNLDSSPTILADYTTPAGLRELVSDKPLIDALKISDSEWQTLRSIQLPGNVDKDGYVQLLITIRTVTRT